MPDDELNQNLTPENPGFSGDPQNGEGEELGQIKARVSELENLVAQKDEELTKATAHITELEQAIAEKDEKLGSLNDSLSQAVSSYKALVVQANPDALSELITGDTIEAISQSLEKARSLIGKVRQGLEAEIVATRVPSGAPQRTSIDLSALSPREKIEYAIGGKK